MVYICQWLSTEQRSEGVQNSVQLNSYVRANEYTSLLYKYFTDHITVCINCEWARTHSGHVPYTLTHKPATENTTQRHWTDSGANSLDNHDTSQSPTNTQCPAANTITHTETRPSQTATDAQSPVGSS